MRKTALLAYFRSASGRAIEPLYTIPRFDHSPGGPALVLIADIKRPVRIHQIQEAESPVARLLLPPKSTEDRPPEVRV